jgi:hypothetical protein
MTAQSLGKTIPSVLGPGDRDYERWRSELEYFFQVRRELWERLDLRSKYVAIYRHEVIDVHEDQFELGRRMCRQHPGEVVLIVKVELEDPRIKLPSFELQ